MRRYATCGVILLVTGLALRSTLWAQSILAVPAISAMTYYVRPDGGSQEQYTGRADAPYPGSGSGQPCAWDHPFRALPPGGPAHISGGDALISASGSYMMGLGAPGATECSSDYPWDCYMPPIPSGPDEQHPTRILGVGWNTGCAAPPELWGAERAYNIINLAGSSNVQIACMEITDHAGCVEFHRGGWLASATAIPSAPGRRSVSMPRTRPMCISKT